MNKRILSIAFSLSFTCLVVLGVIFNSWLKDFDPEKMRLKDRLITNLAKLTNFAYLPFTLSQSNLPTYFVFTNEEQLEQLINQLPTPFTNTVLKKDQKLSIPAKLFHQNDSFNINLQIHGDLRNHWSLHKKSWQLTFKKINPLMA